MEKLLILDKDGTLVRPKTGGDFVQHPEDQELLPGAKDAIAHYRSKGWCIVVASNQGGCAIQKCKPEDFPVGAYFLKEGHELKIIDKRHSSWYSSANLENSAVFLRISQHQNDGFDWISCR